jgi:hypothetical protein
MTLFKALFLFSALVLLGVVTMRGVLVSEVGRERGEREAYGAPPGAARRVRLEG